MASVLCGVKLFVVSHNVLFVEDKFAYHVTGLEVQATTSHESEVSLVVEFENDDNNGTNIDMLGIPLGDGGTIPLSDDQMSEVVGVSSDVTI